MKEAGDVFSLKATAPKEVLFPCGRAGLGPGLPVATRRKQLSFPSWEEQGHNHRAMGCEGSPASAYSCPLCQQGRTWTLSRPAQVNLQH